jgi:hypothetical protein
MIAFRSAYIFEPVAEVKISCYAHSVGVCESRVVLVMFVYHRVMMMILESMRERSRNLDFV